MGDPSVLAPAPPLPPPGLSFPMTLPKAFALAANPGHSARTGVNPRLQRPEKQGGSRDSPPPELQKGSFSWPG